MRTPKDRSDTSCWRNQRLAKIHIAQKALVLTDDDYRAILDRLFGVTSAKDLSADQHHRLLAEFRRLGWKPPEPKKAAKAKPTLVSLREPQLRKIRLLWHRLLEAGVIRSNEPSALNHFAKRITGVERLEWLSVRQATQVIEALKAWCTRHGITV